MGNSLRKLFFIAAFLALALVPSYDLLFKRSFPPDYYLSKIKLTTAERLKELIEYRQRVGVPMLLYVYNIDCPICSINLEEIEKARQKHPQNRLAVLAIAVEDDPRELSAFLANKGEPISFTPLMLHPSEESDLRTVIKSLEIEYKEPPLIIVISRSQQATVIPPGLGRKNRLEKRLREVIPASQRW